MSVLLCSIVCVLLWTNLPETNTMMMIRFRDVSREVKTITRNSKMVAILALIASCNLSDECGAITITPAKLTFGRTVDLHVSLI